jgi:hypothetical protein
VMIDIVLEVCGRCNRALTEAEEEICIGCEGPLCVMCWDEFGECGHPELREMRKELVRAKTWDERKLILDRLGPIGSPRIARRFN